MPISSGKKSLLTAIGLITLIWGIFVLTVVLTSCARETPTTRPPTDIVTPTHATVIPTSPVPAGDSPFSMKDLWGVTGQQDPPGSHPTGQSLLELMTGGNLS